MIRNGRLISKRASISRCAPTNVTDYVRYGDDKRVNVRAATRRSPHKLGGKPTTGNRAISVARTRWTIWDYSTPSVIADFITAVSPGPVNNRAFVRPERLIGKLIRAVLWGRGGSNAALLPDVRQAWRVAP